MQLPNLNFWVCSKQTCYSYISQYNGAISPSRPVMVKKTNKLKHNPLKKLTATNDGQVEQPKKRQ